MTTKSKILKLGQSQLQRHGFNGFSFQDLADAIQIRKASLHYYFSSKQELGLAMIKDFEQQFETWSEMVEGLSAEQKLKKYFKIFHRISEDHQKICPTGSLISDFGRLSKSLQNEIQQFHQTHRNWITQTIRQGIEEGHFQNHLKADTTADLILSCIQGSLQICRLKGSSQTFEKVQSMILSQILIPYK